MAIGHCPAPKLRPEDLNNASLGGNTALRTWPLASYRIFATPRQSKPAVCNMKFYYTAPSGVRTSRPGLPDTSKSARRSWRPLALQGQHTHEHGAAYVAEARTRHLHARRSGVKHTALLVAGFDSGLARSKKPRASAQAVRQETWCLPSLFLWGVCATARFPRAALTPA